MPFFQRDYPMVFGQKWQFLQLHFLRQSRPVNCVLRYPKTKKRLSRLIKTRSSNRWKIAIVAMGINRWFWSKNGNFFIFFFLGNIGQEDVFYDIVERKNPFLAYKNKKFKKSKNCHFSKGVNPWFLEKNGHFFNFFFLGNIDHKNVFYDILAHKKRLSRL